MMVKSEQPRVKAWWPIAGVVTAMLLAVMVGSASAGILTNQVAAKAQPDECFVGVGSASNQFPAGPSCSTGTPKVNQAYVWGLTEASSQLWFGTAANVECLVLGGFLGLSTPIQTSSYACEFGANVQFHSDWRPPKIYSYNLSSKKLTAQATVPGLTSTLGIRSAGSLNGVVFLAGPSLQGTGIYLFAYSSAGAFLGSTQLSNYRDIRQWVVFNNNLYTGVQAADGTGRILHWIGNQANPFQFEEVGQTDAEVSYLAVQGSRLYATTWGGANTPNRVPSGLWVSPVETVLSPNDLTGWQEIWNVNNYEVDPVTAATLLGGAIASYQGSLYFGLMQVPFTGALAHYAAYPSAPSGPLDKLLAIAGATRAIPIFRTNGNPANVQTQMLYGAAQLPLYNNTTQTWSLVPNAAGSTPLYGPPGFGNPFNTYTWSANVYANHLFFGTFDWSYLLGDGLPLIAQELGFSEVNLDALMNAFGPLALINGLFPDFAHLVGPQFFEELAQGQLPPIVTNLLEHTLYGADLWRFDNNRSPAQPENVTGVGNYLNYGIRTMVSDSSHLYLGTANPMNLKTAPGQADGGWELHILTGPPSH
jgi:hypothetical protein